MAGNGHTTKRIYIHNRLHATGPLAPTSLTQDGRTPLHLAALGGHDDCARLLLERAGAGAEAARAASDAVRCRMSHV